MRDTHLTNYESFRFMIKLAEKNPQWAVVSFCCSLGANSGYRTHFHQLFDYWPGEEEINTSRSQGKWRISECD